MFKYAMAKCVGYRVYLLLNTKNDYSVSVLSDYIKSDEPIFYREFDNFNDAKETFLRLSYMEL